MSTDGPLQPGRNNSVVDTLQSLIVAFVLAMTFRGFVTEGFVIPTGSMAPTLLGQHQLVHSEQTGLAFPVGLDQSPPPPPNAPPPDLSSRIADPMLGPASLGAASSHIPLKRRMGDRILVLKCLYPFSEPKRFDVVVFKNPTDPVGEAANYIKRLIGLPNEQIWLADGDVFARRLDGQEFRIQRKPQHVQRAVWQTVHQSDYLPINPKRLDRRYEGPPWVGDSSVWRIDGRRSYECTSAEPTELTWDNARRPLDDWSPYNMITGRPPIYSVSDLRVSAGIVAQQLGWKATLELEARSHLFQFIVQGDSPPGHGQALVRMRPLDDEAGWIERTAPVKLPRPGQVLNVEFSHADQSLHLSLNGKQVMPPLEYDWQAHERLRYASGAPARVDIDAILARPILSPKLRWRFEGSPLTLHRVRVDRDLFYRRDTLEPGRSQQKNMPHLYGPAFGTHPTQNGAILNADQFMMCGDNSQMSLDSRLWGSPHALVASQIDASPFIVNRKLLLGKAWVVYFPAPFSITQGGVPIVPDFGRLRFIR